jgi:glycosyltransferase involved in cell wall biosynthesis
MTRPPHRHRVVVAGHDLKFFRPLQEALAETGRFEFRHDVWTGHNTHDEASSRELLAWAEIIICEWCLGNAVWYSRHKHPDQHMVVRFHLQERMTESPRLVALEAIHTIVFVGHHIQREAQERLWIPADKTCLIPNLVDVARFDLPKYPGACFNLGMIGLAPRRKRLDLAIDLLERLKAADDRYCLHVKGAHPTDYAWLWARPQERSYYQELFRRINASAHVNSIVFDPQADDVPDWFRCIGFVLSPSDFESFHMAISEGMSAGCLPIIWDWEGARQIHPSEYVVTSVELAAEKIERLRLDPGLAARMDEARAYVRERFDRNVIRDRWLEVLEPDPTRLSSLKACPEPVAAPVAKRPLLVIYAIDNWDTFHRREMIEALAHNLRDAFDLLVIEPGSHYRTLLDRGMAQAWELQAFLGLEPIRVTDNLWRFRSLTGGFPAWIEAPGDLGSHRDARQLLGSRIRMMFPGERPILHWIYKPSLHREWVPVSEPFVYECYDDYTRDFATGERLPAAQEREATVLRSARATFFTSQVLLADKGPASPKPVLAENGVAYRVFAAHRQEQLPPGPLQVGYLGNLSDFFDWAAMHQAALDLPAATFWFHGPIDPKARERLGAQVDRLVALPNCRFTGRMGRDEGARAIAGYHVLLIPFVQNAAMDAVNPLKLWEYFATGRPVVSSPMRALVGHDDAIRFARSGPEWAPQIQAAFEQDTPELRERRIELARQHDWMRVTQAHATTLLELLESL